MCWKTEAYKREESQNRKRRAGLINTIRNIRFFKQRRGKEGIREYKSKKSILKMNV